MTPTVLATLLTFFVTCIESIGLSLMRVGGYKNLVLASMIYGWLVAPILYFTIPLEGVGLTNFLWNVFSTVLMFIIGVYYFQEKIKYLQVMGVLVSFVGIAMVLMAPDS